MLGVLRADTILVDRTAAGTRNPGGLMFETVMLNSAYVALIAGSQRKDLVSLRILMIAAAIAFIIYGTARGIWPMVGWNVVIGGNHLRLLARGLRPPAEVDPVPEPVRLHAVRLVPDAPANPHPDTRRVVPHEVPTPAVA
jgi:hypothetical protein